MLSYFFLIPISIGLGAVGLAVFLWSLNSGQYEDLDGAAERILFEDGDKSPALETDLSAADAPHIRRDPQA